VHLVRDGQVRQVAGGLAFPNGMAVLAGALVVAESHGHRLTAFDIGADGSLGARRVWAEVEGSAPDGICVDGDTVWYADVPNRCCVRVAEGGEVLDRVELDRGGFACAIGDGTLYIVAAEFLGMAELVAAGSGQVLATPLAGR
jgi:sugar lactone lactonase YvrE